MAAICAACGVEPDDDITIGAVKYHNVVMESDYDEDAQISSKEGDLVFWNMVTYGYGESVKWGELEAQEAALEAWAQATCAAHQCDYEIRVTANYW